MASVAQAVVREPATENTRQYSQRVHVLAGIYLVLFTSAIAGVVLLIWKAQHLVTLSQRSNVETLTIAFMLVFFGYMILLTAPGALGGARVLFYLLLAALPGDRAALERRKQAAASRSRGLALTAALNMAVELDERPGEGLSVDMRDEAGLTGHVALDGCRLSHVPVLRQGSDDVLAYFVQELKRVLNDRDVKALLDIVEWKKIDDEATEQYLSLAGFARNLERHLQAGELWPKVSITEADRAELERRMSALCPSVRSEAFLPQWEYSGQHKLPLIPEPLALVTLTRAERRVDPLPSMGCAMSVVLAGLFVICIFIFFPPWVPGS